MSVTVECPTCGQPHAAPDTARGPHYCSLACFNTGHGIAQPRSPSCHDTVTMTCPVCQRTFVPTGRQKFCSDACRAAAYRRRRDARPAALDVPKSQPRRPITVYECDACGDRALGEQRCETCNIWMRRVGIGGSCPSCGDPVALSELVGQEVIATS